MIHKGARVGYKGDGLRLSSQQIQCYGFARFRHQNYNIAYSAQIRGHVSIDLLAILQKSLDRAIFLYNFIREVR